jgi:hypothetical protein
MGDDLVTRANGLRGVTGKILDAHGSSRFQECIYENLLGNATCETLVAARARGGEAPDSNPDTSGLARVRAAQGPARKRTAPGFYAGGCIGYWQASGLFARPPNF